MLQPIENVSSGLRVPLNSTSAQTSITQNAPGYLSQTINNVSSGSRNILSEESDDRRFLADYKARDRLLRFNEELNIRELSHQYSTSSRPKNKGKKVNYKATVILLKSQKANKVPAPEREK